jgi:hypothetical protein
MQVFSLILAGNKKAPPFPGGLFLCHVSRVTILFIHQYLSHNLLTAVEENHRINTVGYGAEIYLFFEGAIDLYIAEFMDFGSQLVVN